MVTGEYHNKNVMALYTVHVCLHVLHTHFNHILLHDGNKNTNTGNLRPDNTWNDLMFSSRALLRDSSSHTTFDLCTGGLRSVHQFSIVNLCINTNMRI